MNQLDPQRRQHKTNYPHNGKDVLPAPGESQPAKQRRKERQREILRRVKDGGGSTTFFRREPGGDNTGVRREGRCFREPQHKAHKEHGDPCPGQREHINKALQEGEQRPEKEAVGVNFFRAKLIKQPAAGDLHQQVGPAKSGEDVTHRNRT